MSGPYADRRGTPAPIHTDGREYLSVKLDVPSFSAPIYANLFAGRGREEPLAHLVTPQWQVIPGVISPRGPRAPNPG